MSSNDKILVPNSELMQMLHLNQVVLTVFQGLSEKDDSLLTAKLADVCNPRLWGVMQTFIEDASEIHIAHLLLDIMKSIDLLTEYLKDDEVTTPDTVIIQ